MQIINPQFLFILHVSQYHLNENNATRITEESLTLQLNQICIKR